MKDEIIGIENKIRRVIAEWDMLPPGCRVLAGLSGGADSMALTHFLLNYGKERHIRIAAAHINHGIRGGEAESDERFVREWCGQNGVELHVLRADVPKLAAERSQGLEECGRAVRYHFFRDLCGEGDRIATAHTLSDNAETVLMNLAKGAGSHGLRGIPPVRGNIVRPLLGITRAEVEKYCAFYGLPFVTDSTNCSDVYARNKLRLSVVPVLKGINPAFESAVCGMSRRLGEDDDYLTGLAERALPELEYHGGYRIDGLRALPGPVLARAVLLAVRQRTQARLSAVHIDAVREIIGKGSGSVTVAGGIQCAAQGNTLFIASGGCEVPWSVPFCAEGTPLPDGRTLSIAKWSRKEFENRFKINNLLFNNGINYDTIFKISSVRNRRSGDVFRPAGRGVTKSLKKLFNEAGLEPMLRPRAAMLESGGTIAWIEGFGASQEFRITDRTQNVAEIIIV